MQQRDLGRIFVTGADGFIGSHLTERLVADGHNVTALCVYNSSGSYGWLEELAEKSPSNLRIVLGDVRDPFQMESAIKGHDTVLHLAALIAVPFSYVAPQSYVETNISGTLNVAQACLKAGVKRMVHTSTSEVYGTAKTVPIREDHPLQGQSPYSASKIGADALIDSFYRSFELPVTTLRPFNTFGPRQSFRAVIPTVIGQLVAGAKKIELGSLDPTRDFNYVSNTVEAFIAVARAASDAVHGEVFNAGTGREVTIGETVELICRLYGVKVEIVVADARLRPAKSEVERLLADARKLSVATGWTPVTSLEEGLTRTIEWHRARPRSARNLVYQT